MFTRPPMTHGYGPTRPSRCKRPRFTATRQLRAERLERRDLLATVLGEPSNPYATVPAASLKDGNDDLKAASEFVPNEILVGFAGAVSVTYQRQGGAAALTMAGQLVGSHGLSAPRILAQSPSTAAKPGRLATHWRLPPGADVLKMAERLSALPGIAYAEPNYVLTAAATPNDPDFSQLWGLDNTGQTGGASDADIDAVEAWDVATGSNSIVVGVVDSGVDYSHLDLAANIWTNSGESLLGRVHTEASAAFFRRAGR